ncbi:MAG: erythromycin biosynthesis sensory transduction protein eryC1 [Deltaproteobacteria bacterium HGW-Deltaproteobacteria-21]|nr:MAG: erythromycin biosynthesis sensory transduction protein eryC1 [Deltaproteobacteria bacterium HGW-Deltaproteobacteria-21]
MIPQNNPHANYLGIKAEIDQAISKVLDSGRYILGEETAAFEREFAEFLGARFVVGVANGTEAICLALRACGIRPGDKVITASHTAVATVAAIEMCGAVPLLVEIDPATYTMDPASLTAAMTKNTRAIVPVHLYGHPADVEPILKFAKEKGLFVIEDCAQAHGAAIHGRKTGTWGHAAAFSFYPTKNLGCLGDGGAVTTNDPEIHEKLIAARQYGWDRERVSRTEGINSRLDEIQAAVLRVKLRQLDESNRKRVRVAARYSECLSLLPLSLPVVLPGKTHVYHQYVIRLSDRKTRDALLEFLKAGSIQTSIHYPAPVHLQPFYSDRFGRSDSLIETEKVCETILSLPMFPELTSTEIDRICDRIHAFFREV